MKKVESVGKLVVIVFFFGEGLSERLHVNF